MIQANIRVQSRTLANSLRAILVMTMVAVITAVSNADSSPQRGKCFTITVVDDQTNRGVPLVELQTVNNIRFYTDSNGIAAFDEPGLMNQTVFFHVKSHGYEFAKDGFGYRGKAIAIKEGGSIRLLIKRVNIAERLYRITGEGIYRDSILVGQPVPTRQPLLNGQVFGSDSVENTLYRGKIYWFWGDTNRPGYPLGNFDVPGATSALPADGGLNPSLGVDLTYFVDAKGFAKPMAKMPGSGPTWIGGLITLREPAGRERMFASYVKVKGLLEIYERGLAEYNDDKQQFDKVVTFEEKAPIYPGGHPFLRSVDGVEYIYFANSYPHTRVRATAEHLRNLKEYEAFTCLRPGSRLDQLQVDRDSTGKILYAWKKNTPPLDYQHQAKMVRAGQMQADESLIHLQDVNTGKTVVAHGGSVYWNDYRKRWVMITVESAGTSFLGEVWYAEADTPLGPWMYARKVVTHEKYSFYNPKQHPFFDQDGGRQIFFEGTYTHTFSGNNEQTPRYDYNQIMHKLDLADPRLFLPVPIYAWDSDNSLPQYVTARGVKSKSQARVAFFAPDRAAAGTIPVYISNHDTQSLTLDRASSKTNSEPMFYVLPADAKEKPASAVPLYEFIHKVGKHRAYSPDRDWSRVGFERVDQPVCFVWRNPMRIELPLE